MAGGEAYTCSVAAQRGGTTWRHSLALMHAHPCEDGGKGVGGGGGGGLGGGKEVWDGRKHVHAGSTALIRSPSSLAI